MCVGCLGCVRACFYGHLGCGCVFCSSPCAFSGAQGCLCLLVYVAIRCDLGGRVIGPEFTGPGPELRSLYFDLGSFPLHRLLLYSERTTPERGQMLRRAACQTASFHIQTRPMSPGHGLGRRRGAWGHRSEYAAFLRFTLAGSSRAVASPLWWTRVDVRRLHVRSPGPW